MIFVSKSKSSLNSENDCDRSVQSLSSCVLFKSMKVKIYKYVIILFPCGDRNP
jgi:hypothetical protein